MSNIKLYFYAIIDDRYSKDGSPLSRTVVEAEVIETPKMYKALGKGYLPHMYTSQISKDMIDKVICSSSCSSLDIFTKYLVILTERDDYKAMSLIKEQAEKDRDEISERLNHQNDIIGVICAPLKGMKETDCRNTR